MSLSRLLEPPRALYGLVARADASSLYLWIALSAATVLVLLALLWSQLNALLRFAWHCFIRPIGGATDQKARLEQVLSSACRAVVSI